MAFLNIDSATPIDGALVSFKILGQEVASINSDGTMVANAFVLSDGTVVQGSSSGGSSSGHTMDGGQF